MNKDPILDIHRRHLADLVSEDNFEPFRSNPLDISLWLAMSLMQKAIRRGDIPYALRSAATLLENSPDRLWRRLCVTAFEDIGVSDTETLSLVMAGLSGKVLAKPQWWWTGASQAIWCSGWHSPSNAAPPMIWPISQNGILTLRRTDCV